jgi:TolB protein
VCHLQGEAIKLEAIIKKDLRECGVFQINPYSRQPQSFKDALIKLNISVWHREGVELLCLVSGKQVGRQLKVTCQLWDLLRGKKAHEFELKGRLQDKGRLAHLIANDIYKLATGTPGYFDTHITYVAGVGQGYKTRFRLGVMALDGSNHKYLAYFRSLLKMPRVDMAKKRVIYIRNEKRYRNQVFVYDFVTRREKVLAVPGNIFSVFLVPETDELIVSFLENGQSVLARFSPQEKKTTTLLPKSNFIDTYASLNTKSNMLLFNSNRDCKRPQIYVAKDQQVRQLSSGDGAYYSPVWSPDGDSIAFIKRDGEGFHLSTLRLEGKKERIVATFYWAESPCWVPSGNALLIAGQLHPSDSRQLYFVDLNSSKVRRLKTPDQAIEPCSSNLP